MDDSLKNALLSYQTALNQHLLVLKEEFEMLETAWRSLNDVYEGSAAEEFKEAWRKTMVDFEDSIGKIETILSFLQEITENA
ncbi:MAG: hypothetical protein F6K24_36945 [Okeania sp. SIO2D1]|nr:hypothetical protein [Okeania sp. SIO2D1]